MVCSSTLSVGEKRKQNKKNVDFSHPKASDEETHKSKYLKETANKTTWALTQFPGVGGGWAPTHADLLNREGTICFKRVRQQESLHHWIGSTLIEGASMHCGSEDKQTLWCITEGGKTHTSTSKCGRCCPWMRQIKSPPSHCEGSQRLLTKSAYTNKPTRGWMSSCISCSLSAWRYVNLPTNTHKPPKSSLRVEYPGWPAWERLSAKTHYGGDWMTMCTIQGFAMQPWYLCKNIPTLSE